MDALQITLTVTAYANVIASQLEDEDLELLASIFNQFGDTLITILAQRSKEKS